VTGLGFQPVLPQSMVIMQCRRLQDLLVLQGTTKKPQELSLKTQIDVLVVVVEGQGGILP